MDLVVLLVCMESGISDRDSFNVRISELLATEKENENVQARVHLSFERCIRQRAPAGLSKAVFKLLGQSSPCDFAPAIATDDSDDEEGRRREEKGGVQEEGGKRREQGQG